MEPLSASAAGDWRNQAGGFPGERRGRWLVPPREFVAKLLRLDEGRPGREGLPLALVGEVLPRRHVRETVRPPIHLGSMVPADDNQRTVGFHRLNVD
jgi:hypothetical protein